MVPPTLTFGIGLLGLLCSVVLLLVVLALRRVAEGAAIAENMSYVMAGVLCLATSVLLGWIARLTDTDFSPEQARLGSDLLVIASMVFFGIYFYRVRRAMVRFLDTMTAGALADTGEEEILARIHCEEAEADV